MSAITGLLGPRAGETRRLETCGTILRERNALRQIGRLELNRVPDEPSRQRASRSAAPAWARDAERDAGDRVGTETPRVHGSLPAVLRRDLQTARPPRAPVGVPDQPRARQAGFHH